VTRTPALRGHVSDAGEKRDARRADSHVTDGLAEGGQASLARCGGRRCTRAACCKRRLATRRPPHLGARSPERARTRRGGALLEQASGARSTANLEDHRPSSRAHRGISGSVVARPTHQHDLSSCAVVTSTAIAIHPVGGVRFDTTASAGPRCSPLRVTVSRETGTRGQSSRVRPRREPSGLTADPEVVPEDPGQVLGRSPASRSGSADPTGSGIAEGRSGTRSSRKCPRWCLHPRPQRELVARAR